MTPRAYGTDWAPPAPAQLLAAALCKGQPNLAWAHFNVKTKAKLLASKDPLALCNTMYGFAFTAIAAPKRVCMCTHTQSHFSWCFKYFLILFPL